MTTAGERQIGVPELGGSLEDDAAALARHSAAVDELLAHLGPKPRRAPGQASRAEAALTARRELCDRFMHLHTGGVYDALTQGRTRYLRLSELVLAAAERFPGLVPTQRQLASESAFHQADKDGREIEQGVFFRALLRDRQVAAHLTDAMLLPTPRARELLETFRCDGSVDLGAVLVERRGSAAHLTVRNDHCLNAEDNRLIEDMEAAVDLVHMHDGVRAAVLRGGVMSHPRYRGKRVFSAGINLRDLHAGRIGFVDFLLTRELGYINKISRGVLPRTPPHARSYPHRTVQKTWIAAVDSFAIGGGMQLLMAFDWVIAADDAWFSLPAAQEGIVPGMGNLRLGRLTGARMSRRIILGGHRIAAADPEAPLVCDEVVPPEEVTAAVETAVQALDSPAVEANRRMINLAEESDEQFRAYAAEFALMQAHRLYGADVMNKLDDAWSSGEDRT